MAQQIGALANKLDDLSPSPGIQLGKERTNSSKLSSDLYRHTIACMCPHHTHKHKNIVKEITKKMFTVAPFSCVKTRNGVGGLAQCYIIGWFLQGLGLHSQDCKNERSNLWPSIWHIHILE